MYRTRPSTPDDLAGRDLRFYLFYRRSPSMSGQLPYERRIDKNVRGLSANERTQTPFFYLSRFSPGVPLLCPLRPPLVLFPPSLNVTLLFFPIHSFTFNIDELSPVSSLHRDLCCSFPVVDSVRSFGRVYRETRSCIRPGNRLGFVKVECTGENRSSPL